MLLVALFVVYLLLLTWIVIWKLEVPWIGEAWSLPRPIKLVPFLASGDAGASNPVEVIANILFFVPFGLYLGLLAPSWRWWMATAVFVGASLVLEITQHLISVGSFDISDVISNTAGGLAGLGLLALARRRLQTRATVFMIKVCLVGSVILVLAVAIFVASPLHYGPQHDVVVHLNGTRGTP
jgi:glycopeptide antibiotics resistance protein